MPERWLIPATLHVAETTLVIVILVEIGRRSSPAPAIAIALAVVVVAIAVAGIASGRASLVTLAVAAAVVPLLAVNSLTDWEQTLLSSAALLAPGLMVAHVAVQRRPRSLASVASVVIASVVYLAVHVRFVDPFRMLDCAPQCAPNPFAPSHHPLFGTVARVLLAVAIAWWAAAEGRRARVGRRVVVLAASIAGWTVLVSNNWARVLTASTKPDVVLLAVAAIAWAVVTVDGVVRDGKQVLLRRRVLATSRALGSEAEPRRAAEMLTESLRDPHVRIAYARPNGGHVDADGVEVDWPSTAGRPPVQLTRAGGAVAVIDSVSTDFVGALTPQLIIAIENESMLARTRAMLADLRDSRQRLVTKADEERHRLERDLHDGAQQRLLTISMLLTGGGAGVDSQRLDAARAEAAHTLAQLRRIARGLYPAVLDQFGLEPALQSYLDEAPLAVELAVDGIDASLPNALQRLAYRLVRTYCELAGQAGATIITVSLGQRGGELVVSFVHDGDAVADAVDIEDRVGAVGGRWTTSADDAGCSAEAVIPCA
jgi:signal transduction histidine kinase